MTQVAMPDVKLDMVTERGGHRVLCSVNGTRLQTPPVEHLLFYAGLGALAAFEVIEWPVAGLLMVGHILVDLTNRPGLAQLGKAFEEI